MAKLRVEFDGQAFWIKKLLHQGRREAALAKLAKALEDGTAGAETKALAEYLESAPRGRQPFGAKHLWVDIGQENDRLRSIGMSHEDRMRHLGLRFNLNDEAKLKTAIAQYEFARDEARRIECEEYGR